MFKRLLFTLSITFTSVRAEQIIPGAVTFNFISSTLKATCAATAKSAALIARAGLATGKIALKTSDVLITVGIKATKATRALCANIKNNPRMFAAGFVATPLAIAAAAVAARLALIGFIKTVFYLEAKSNEYNACKRAEKESAEMYKRLHGNN